MNKKIAKSRENTNPQAYGISPEEITWITEHGHIHDWQYAASAPDFTKGGYHLKFVCVCGGYKWVKQFEVEE